MSSFERVALITLCLSFAQGCAETGQQHVSIPVFARGTELSSLRLPGGTFTLKRADVAVGPIYFCAASGADAELCEASVAEFTGNGVLDALAPEEMKVFSLRGVTGSIRSALYDYGVSWFTTEQAPDAKTELGHSAILEGVLTRDSGDFRFVAHIDVEPRTRGGFAVSGQPTQHDIGEDDRLVLTLNPYQWLRAINLDALAALDTDDSGEVRIVPGTQAYEAILQGMQNRAPMAFDWD